MSNVVGWNGITRLKTDPDRILSGAIGRLERCIVIGETRDGEEFFESTDADGGAVLWDIERAKLKLLQIADKIGRDDA